MRTTHKMRTTKAEIEKVTTLAQLGLAEEDLALFDVVITNGATCTDNTCPQFSLPAHKCEVHNSEHDATWTVAIDEGQYLIFSCSNGLMVFGATGPTKCPNGYAYCGVNGVTCAGCGQADDDVEDPTAMSTERLEAERAVEAQRRADLMKRECEDCDRVHNLDREPTELCEAGTVGCSIDHTKDQGGCEGW